MGFPTTRVSLVDALTSTAAGERRAAADRLAALYWVPIYQYIRVRWRRNPDDAEDLVQMLFEKLADKDLLRAFEPDRGRLRTYLRRCLDSLAKDAHRRESAARRRLDPASRVEIANADAEIARLADGQDIVGDPEALFTKHWRRRLIALSAAAARAELERKGKLEHLAVLERLVLGDEDDRPSHAALAEELGLTVVDINNRLSYAKRAFRRALVSILRETTASDAEFKAEAEGLGLV